MPEMLDIGYLGPGGSFSEIAAIKYSGGQYNLMPFRTITDVLDATKQEKVYRSIVPFENLLGGEVVDTVDYFIANMGEGGLKITGELLLPITQALLCNLDLVQFFDEVNKVVIIRLDKIHKVITHPQAWLQCQSYLRQYNWKFEETTSTAKAAEIVASSDDPGIVAIASQEAAEMHNLHIIASNIGDNKKNVTRFIVVGGEDIEPTGNDKTTIIFTTVDSPGALHEALGPFHYLNINMDKLFSRTRKTETLGECAFWVDVRGHLGDEDRSLHNAINAMRRFTKSLWVVGSYPRANGNS